MPPLEQILSLHPKKKARPKMLASVTHSIEYLFPSLVPFGRKYIQFTFSLSLSFFSFYRRFKCRAKKFSCSAHFVFHPPVFAFSSFLADLSNSRCDRIYHRQASTTGRHIHWSLGRAYVVENRKIVFSKNGIGSQISKIFLFFSRAYVPLYYSIH